MRSLHSNDTVHEFGRGTIKVFDHLYPESFSVGEVLNIDGKRYEVIGIEGRMGCRGPLKGIGLRVKEV